MKLTYRMRETLRELQRNKNSLSENPKHWGEGGMKASNTNFTMNALEKRGLVEATWPPRCHPWRPLWVITDAGEAAMKEA